MLKLLTMDFFAFVCILGVKILADTKDMESEIDIYLGFKYLPETKRHFSVNKSKHNRKIQLI